MTMQNLWCKRKSILFSWLISYTILLLIPLLISGIVYIQSVKTISDEINRANGALLDQWQQTMDSRIRDIYQLALQLGWNQNVQGIIYVREPLKGTHHYTIHKIINDIKFYRTANEFISNIYLYIKNIDSILTPSARYESELFFEHYHNCGDMTYYQWLNVLRNRYFKKYVTLPTKRDDQTISESIACIQSIPIENPHMPMATVIILIDKSQIFSTIQNNKLLQQGIVLILNKEDEIIFSSEPIDLSDSIKYSNLSKKHGLIESHLNGEKITVSYISSQFNDWKYISIIPSKIFMEKARYIYRLITLSLFLCLLLGGIFTFIFTKKNYNPVQSLVNLLIKKSGISIKQIYNEYDFINNAISNTLDEKEKIQKKLQQQAVTLKTNFLIQLLKGKINENLPIDDALATYGIDFISDCFVVMLIYIDDYGNFLNNEKLVSANQNIDLVHFIIKNVIEELTSKNHRSFVVEIDDMLACLVNLNEIHSDNWKNESIQIAQKAQKWLEENFNIYVSISVSQVCDSIDNISMAYQQALKAMEYRIVVGYKNIIHYDSISASSFSNSSYYYPIEVEQQLINFIKSGDYEQAHGIVNKIFHKNLSSGILPVEVVKCLLFDLICTILKALDEISIIYEDIFCSKESLIDKLLKCETATEIKYEINNILKEACDRINESQTSHNKQLIEDIIKYIDTQYYDIDLNVSKIADHFQMNLSYLSKFFKKQTGQGLLDYINKVRIEKAKEILKEEVLSIKDVSAKVGFYNSNAFIRVFKKYEGVTPGKYRADIAK